MRDRASEHYRMGVYEGNAILYLSTPSPGVWGYRVWGHRYQPDMGEVKKRMLKCSQS